MTFIWLIVWLISHTPQVQIFDAWNNWGVALGVCLAIDLIGALGANAWRQRTYLHGFGRTWEPGSGWRHASPLTRADSAMRRLDESDSQSDNPVGFSRSQVPITLGPSSGYTRNGLPYNRFGQGRRIAVIFQGLLFENKPLAGFTARFFRSMYQFLEDQYTYFIVLRRPHLPEGFSMREMSNDYATMIQQEFLQPVDVIGQSTGGSIAQHFAADHPDLVRNLVLHSTADRLSAKAKAKQLQMAAFARRHEWARAYAAGLTFMFPTSGIGKYAAKPVLWLGSLLAAWLAAPKDPADLVVTVEAEDKHDFKGRLHEIHAPTLLVAGDQDPFYSKELFEETAAGIPDCRLVLYKGMGHPASGKDFARDVSDFLKTGSGGRLAAASKMTSLKETSPWLR